MAVYIFEGNECCFKTTTCELLSERVGLSLVKGSSFELSQCTNEELYQKFLEFAEMDNVIFDRFIYSNKIYATLYGDYSILTDEQRLHIEQIMKNKTKVIYLTAPDEIIKERLRVRGDDYVNEDKIEAISSMYETVMSEIQHLQVLKFDTSQIYPKEIVDLLISI